MVSLFFTTLLTNLNLLYTFPNLTLFIYDFPLVSVLFLSQFIHGRFSSLSFFIYCSKIVVNLIFSLYCSGRFNDIT